MTSINESIDNKLSAIDSTDDLLFIVLDSGNSNIIENSPRFGSIDTNETRFESIVLESPESNKSITETFPTKNENNNSDKIS